MGQRDSEESSRMDAEFKNSQYHDHRQDRIRQDIPHQWTYWQKGGRGREGAY